MKLKTDIVVTLSANLLFAFSQWVMIASLNYSGNVAAVGQYSYALALAGLFLTFGQTGLRQYLLSRSITEEHLRQLYVTRFLASVVAWGLLLVYSGLFVDKVYFVLVLLLGLAKVVENISDLAHGYYQRAFKVMNIAYSRIARSVLSPIAFLGVFFATDNLAWACFTLCVSWALVYVLFDRKALAPIYRGFKQREHIAGILKQSYSLGITSVLVLLSVSVPLFILARFNSDLEVGQYASVFYFVTAGSLIFQSAMQVISPILVNLLNQKQQSAVRSMTLKGYLLALVFGLTGLVAAIYLGEWVLQLVYGESYSGLGNLVVIAAIINLALAFQAVGGIVLTAFGVFNFQMKVMFMSVVVSLVGGYYLIASFSVSGALYAGALTAAFNAVCFGIKVSRELLKK